MTAATSTASTSPASSGTDLSLKDLSDQMAANQQFELAEEQLKNNDAKQQSVISALNSSTQHIQ